MITSNKELMARARASLQGNWSLAVGAFFIYFILIICLTIFGTGWDLITGAFSGKEIESLSPFTNLINLIVGGPLALGAAIFCLALARQEEDCRMEQIFHGFRQFWRAFTTYFIMVIFILLWSLLLIIPGIIASFAYSQTFFIIAEDPEISPMDAISKSRQIMNGYKWKYFCLNLRFLGWVILSIITFGIGFLWLIPYIQVTLAHFYDDIKEEYKSIE